MYPKLLIVIVKIKILKCEHICSLIKLYDVIIQCQTRYNIKMFSRDYVLKKLAENIRVERARNHFSQEFLAEQADITPQHLYRIENAKTCPTILVVANIAAALGVRLDQLLDIYGE